MQIAAIVVALTVAAVAVALFARAVAQIVSVIRLGQPAVGRTDRPLRRWRNMMVETLGHTRMLQWSHIGVMHWFVFVGFGWLFFTLVTAFGQLFDPYWAIPWLGHWVAYEWGTDIITWLMLVSILGLIVIRLLHLPKGPAGRYQRFFGSRMWQGYFVEYVILGIATCILVLRGAEYVLAGPAASWHDFPLTAFIGSEFRHAGLGTNKTLIYAIAALKIVISFTWMIVLALNTTMGVAWHRFTAWPNIWFKRESSGRTALGALKPMTSGGAVVDFENLEALDEDASLGAGKIEDFSWKGLLDFTSCTECGRCQSQCPAWNTDKPLSPKMVVMALREHAYAKAPYLQADPEQRDSLADLVKAEAERPLVGPTEGDPWWPSGGAVIDPDVLWACTSCGACVRECPVDIEHVDHIMDMRRNQVLVESEFPTELTTLYRGLESKGNPWNMAPSDRLAWAHGLPFDVPVVGRDVGSLAEVEWLFWVGCAGAYEDRAKKTTRAVAELLHHAGVSFAVLGSGETCTGDPARRSGNEFVFQQLAMQNAETLKEAQATKVVATCAHCFNALRNEYAPFGVELEVVHHTQLLNRLVREGKLKPVTPSGSHGDGPTITYHDPCFLGRHNQVYEPPRELLDAIPGATVTEMPRNSERSFCCGAGGARMWMEERIGERININRSREAVATGATQVATGCPYCRVMLSDGVTALQASGDATEETEVLDVAQLLLDAVRRD